MLDSLWQILGSLRLFEVVKSYERGVFMRAGRDVRDVGPGVYWTWPIIDQIDTYSVVPQINRLPAQSLATRDGVSLFVAAVVEYDVADVRLALRAIHDVDAAINDRATKLIAQMIAERSLHQCDDRSELEGEIEEELQEAAQAWGLRIRSFGFTDFSRHQVLRVVGDRGIVPLLN